MNWKLVFALVVVFVCFVDSAKPPGNKKPDNRKREKLSAPRDRCYGEVCVKNYGQSGKFEIKMKNENDTDLLTVLFDAIYEKDKADKKVGKKGKQKHSLETFAPVDFEFTPIEETMFKEEINASYFTFSAAIPGSSANLSVNMYFFTGSGNSSVCENETFLIYPGLVKFDLTIENWTFCTPSTCDGEEGSNLEFIITFQKKMKGRAKEGRRGKNRRLGKWSMKKLYLDNKGIGMPSSYELDDSTCGEMPDGYPAISGKGDKYSVKFRFPKFGHKVFYDPTVGDARDEADYTETSEVPEPATDAPSTTAGPTSAGSNILPSFFVLALFWLIGRLF